MGNSGQDYQSNRILLSKGNMFDRISKKYPDSTIHCGNFGYIVVPQDTTQPVTKIYISQEFYDKEFYYYDMLEYNSFIAPEILDGGQMSFSGIPLYYLRFENIRKDSQAFTSYSDMPISHFSKLLSSLHGVYRDQTPNPYIIHGNPHYSNFYVTGTGDLGMFDFMSMGEGEREYDFASIYFHSSFDEELLSQVLEGYTFSQEISYKRIYYYTMRMIMQGIRNPDYIGESEKKKLQLHLITIKKKFELL